MFVAVYHTENQTNLYISEEQGVEYTLSLDYIVSPPIDDWDDRSPDFGIHVVSVFSVQRVTIAQRQYAATFLGLNINEKRMHISGDEN